MLKKTPVKKSDKMSVLFECTAASEAEQVHLVGEFNDWEPTKTPMKRRKDGAWSVAMRFPAEGRYQYQYVIDGNEWIPDEEADAYVSNPFGGKNSVVVLDEA